MAAAFFHSLSIRLSSSSPSSASADPVAPRLVAGALAAVRTSASSFARSEHLPSGSEAAVAAIWSKRVGRKQMTCYLEEIRSKPKKRWKPKCREVEEPREEEGVVSHREVRNAVAHSKEGEDMQTAVLAISLGLDEVVAEHQQLRIATSGSTSCSISRRRICFLAVSSSFRRRDARRMQMHSPILIFAQQLRRVRSI